MIKSSDQGRDTRDRIVAATLEALKTLGFAGATSRAIARIGGFNQALVFYHFGSLDNLLLAALDKTSEERLRAYRAAVDRVVSLDEVARAAAGLYREDREAGHMTVVSQMFAGSLTRPELAPALVERMEPWIELAEETVDKALAGTPLRAVAPTREIAYGVVTFYVGVNLLTHLDPDRARTDALLERLDVLASALPTS
jgi:AcrR family transcriptional regulator